MPVLVLVSIKTCSLVEIILANYTSFMSSPDTHKNDVLYYWQDTEKGFLFFSLLLKCMLIQLCCGKLWTTGNHNWLKGEPLFSQDKNNTLQTGKKVFYSPSWTHWDNTRLAKFLFSILSHILPLPLFTWVLFLKSHTDACLFYFWMLFLHLLGALSTSVLPCSQGDISLPPLGSLIVDETSLIHQWYLLVTSRVLFREKMQFYLHAWKCPSAALDSAINMCQ